MKRLCFTFACIAALAMAGSLGRAQSQPAKVVTRVPVVFSEGHDTDPRDRGRPVVLVAGGLGVPPQVFRDAFSHVRPAPAGTQPDPQQVRDNKTALMTALGKYGVTNQKLDTVSNYYRYVRNGKHGKQMWPTRPAVANALVENGVVTGYEVVSGGSGYSSAPVVTVPNVTGVSAHVSLSFGKVLESNGSVSALTVGTAAK